MNNYDTNYFYFHYSYIFFKKYYYLYNKKIFKKILKRKNNHLYLYLLFHTFTAGLHSEPHFL